RGSGFDLGIALSILAAAGAIPGAAIDGVGFLGELGLDGRLRPVRGVLPAIAAAAGAGFAKVVVAQANAAEAALVPGLRVVGAPSLAALLALLRGEPASEAGQAACVVAEEPPGPAPGQAPAAGPVSAAGPASARSPRLAGEVPAQASTGPGRPPRPRPDLPEVL